MREIYRAAQGRVLGCAADGDRGRGDRRRGGDHPGDPPLARPPRPPPLPDDRLRARAGPEGPPEDGAADTGDEDGRPGSSSIASAAASSMRTRRGSPRRCSGSSRVTTRPAGSSSTRRRSTTSTSAAGKTLGRARRPASRAQHRPRALRGGRQGARRARHVRHHRQRSGPSTSTRRWGKRWRRSTGRSRRLLSPPLPFHPERAMRSTRAACQRSQYLEATSLETQTRGSLSRHGRRRGERWQSDLFS